MKDLFFHDSQDDSPIVFSDRVLYTPTSFAKTALLYLQEIGSLQAKKPHTSSRTRLSSYLFFCVNSGSGELEYQGKRHKLGKGDCVFIDCQLPYSHSTDTDLWSLSWIHFSSVTMQTVYQKYQKRGDDRYSNRITLPTSSHSISRYLILHLQTGRGHHTVGVP